MRALQDILLFSQGGQWVCSVSSNDGLLNPEAHKSGIAVRNTVKSPGQTYSLPTLSQLEVWVQLRIK